MRVSVIYALLVMTATLCGENSEATAQIPSPTASFIDDFLIKNTSLWSFANNSK